MGLGDKQMNTSCWRAVVSEFLSQASVFISYTQHVAVSSQKITVADLRLRQLIVEISFATPYC